MTPEQKKKLDELETTLTDILPHGSGIDAAWRIERKKNGSIVASSSYHGMNENGFYDGWQDFSVTIYPVTDPSPKCDLCNGSGIRTLDEIAKIRGVDVSSIDPNELKVAWIDEKRFHCNACIGGRISKPVLDIDVSLTGKRIGKEWAIGLADYLYEVIEGCLYPHLANRNVK